MSPGSAPPVAHMAWWLFATRAKLTASNHLLWDPIMKSFTRIVSLVALALSFGAFDASADNAEDRIAQRVENAS